MLGRADGVEVWVNGDSLGVMGSAREVVVSLVLTEKGIAEKRLKKPAPKLESPGDSSHSAAVPQEENNENSGGIE